MKFLATTTLLAAVLLVLPGQVQAQNLLDTGAVLTEVFDDGFVGADPSFAGVGFDFGGDNALFVGNALVGIGGDSDSSPYGGSSDFTNVSATTGFTPAAPFDHFDTGFATSFSSPLGVTMHQDAYALSSSNEQFVVFDLCAENTSGGSLDIFIGYFGDWDAGDFLQNLGDESGGLVYVWDDSGVSTNYFGFSPIGGDVLSGWHESSATDGPGQYLELTTMGSHDPVPNDRRNVAGVALGSVADGDTECAVFAWAAGTDLTDLQSAVADAEAAIAVAIEPGPDGLPGTHNLSSVYPNPFNPQANFTLEVAEQQSVRIAVYDALGREVAMLFNGTLTAGPEHAFTIDGAGLPSGIYMVRATGEQFTDVRRVTLMK